MQQRHAVSPMILAMWYTATTLKMLTYADLRFTENAFLEIMTSTDAESDFERVVLLPETAVKMVSGQEAHIGVQGSEKDDRFFIDDWWLRDWVRRDITAPGN